MDAFNHGFILPAAQFADTTDKHMLYYEARGECNHERRFECKAQIGLAVWAHTLVKTWTSFVFGLV